MDKRSGLIALIAAVIFVSFNPGIFCEAENVSCEGWVSKITRQTE